MLPTRVLWVCDSPALHTGLARVGREILTRLSSQSDFNVSLYACFAEHKEIAIDNYNFHVISGDNHYGRESLHQLLEREKYDILVTFGDIWMMDWLPTLECRPPVWVAAVTIENIEIPLRWLPTLHIADHVVACSSFGYGVLQNTIGKSKLSYIPLGVSPTTFLPSNSRRQKIRSSVGVADKFVVGCVARNQPRKQLASLITMFKTFLTKCPHAVLYLHTDLHDPAGPDLEEIIVRQNIQNYVGATSDITVQAGTTDHDLADIYNMFDVFALPTMGEGFGLPILEALSCGVPVVATDCSAVTELVRGRGELIEVQQWIMLGTQNVNHAIPNPTLFVEALVRLAKDPELLGAYSRAARVFAEENTWSRCATQWTRLLRRLVGNDKVMGSYRQDFRFHGLPINQQQENDFPKIAPTKLSGDLVLLGDSEDQPVPPISVGAWNIYGILRCLSNLLIDGLPLAPHNLGIRVPMEYVELTRYLALTAIAEKSFGDSVIAVGSMLEGGSLPVNYVPLSSPTEARSRMMELLPTARCQKDDKQLIVVAPFDTDDGPSLAWTADQVIHFAQSMGQNFLIIVIGNGTLSPICSDNIIDLTGCISLTESWAIIEIAHALVGNDADLACIAMMVNIPVFTKVSNVNDLAFVIKMRSRNITVFAGVSGVNQNPELKAKQAFDCDVDMGENVAMSALLMIDMLASGIKQFCDKPMPLLAEQIKDECTRLLSNTSEQWITYETDVASMFFADKFTSIIVLNHNTWTECTKECVALLRKSTIAPYEIILIDNGSNQEERSQIAKDIQIWQEVKLVLCDENLGCAGGYNLAFTHISQDSGVVCLVDSDLLMYEYAWNSRMINRIKMDQKIGAVSLTRDEPPYYIDLGTGVIKPGPCVTDSFSSHLLADTFIAICTDRVGIPYFDDFYYPAYWEKADVIFQLQKRGWLVEQLRDFNLVHLGFRTVAKIKELSTGINGDNLRVATDLFESHREYFLKKWGLTMQI